MKYINVGDIFVGHETKLIEHGFITGTSGGFEGVEDYKEGLETISTGAYCCWNGHVINSMKHEVDDRDKKQTLFDIKLMKGNTWSVEGIKNW